MNESSEAPGRTGDSPPQAPAVSLPKGGGAIRGVGEKFAANPATGTGTMTVPLAVSPGRSGFGPQLALSYDSSAGNGPFGFGWSLPLPAVMRKTDKGLPQYHDADESDGYLLSGAEDLVPVLRPDGTRFVDDTTAPGYTLHRYRPRVEGLFARIERWTKAGTGEIHWRSISADNVTTLYGTDNRSRVADPEDASRVFSWLICESFDDKGNAVVYDYVAENSDGVDQGLANERNRVRTANRYIKTIKYGNRVSRLVQPDLAQADWMFEVVFDYDEGHYETLDPDPGRPVAEQHQFVRAGAAPSKDWAVRPDPFSSYRSGFEVRTYRRCRRVLMVHHIPDLPTGEPGYQGLVRSTAFDYADLDYRQQVDVEAELGHQGSSRIASFIRRVTQSGYVRAEGSAAPPGRGEHATYLRKSLPPLEFEYSRPVVRSETQDAAPEPPDALAGFEAGHRWVDLYGDGVPGILTEQATGWFYRRNLSPLRQHNGAPAAVCFGSAELVGAKPNLPVADGRAQFMDLAGDGLLDLVVLDGPEPGMYEQDGDEGWLAFRPFTSRLNRRTRAQNIRFVDLNGDGHADVLITEGDALVWHPSLAEEGFGPARHVAQPFDDETGPRLVFSDGTETIFLADMCGDGLTDLVRVRGGEVCYWPNLGHGRFAAKVTMDNAPRLDEPDIFDPRRLLLADIDGSGTTDIIYLHRDGVRLYFNQTGSRMSDPVRLRGTPAIHNQTVISTADLRGTGTACLVWWSRLPSDNDRPMRYIDLMGGAKPHLLTRVVNNLGAELKIHYAVSTRFCAEDKRAGRPWVSRLPFPVHVVERLETFDHISGHHFVTRYAYHHGFFDGEEREFRGFGMVEQWDTEHLTQAQAGDLDRSSHVPPVLTRTWFHTGIHFGRERVADTLAGLLTSVDKGEYYREPGLDDGKARALLLADTVLPDGLTPDEEREACRALRGSVLRQEIYALDDTGTTEYPYGHPYTVTEQNFTVRQLQARASNRHGVFLAHANESITYYYNRDPSDPRTGHMFTLAVDDFGNVIRSATIGYGRRRPDPSLPPTVQSVQAKILITYTENEFTNEVDAASERRVPQPCETRTYELTGLRLSPERNRFTAKEIREAVTAAEPLDYGQTPTAGKVQKRLIEHSRTYYRRNDLTGPLQLGKLQSLALPHESYTLAFTADMILKVYGDRAAEAEFESEGGYVHTEGDLDWWVPSGKTFYSPGTGDSPAEELTFARRHFFLPHRRRDPFHTSLSSTESITTYDVHNLLAIQTRDALGNRVTVGERHTDPAGPIRAAHDYRVLQPALVMDPNRNRVAVRFDALGMVVGTAVMGKPEDSPAKGDRLTARFRADLTPAELDAFLADPGGPMAKALLDEASTRVVLDPAAYWRSLATGGKQPAVVAALAREQHFSEAADGRRIQVSLSYSDGFGREVQRKIQAEPGLAPRRDAHGHIVFGDDNRPLLAEHRPAERWVASGWTIFNNKGKPVRQFEPFFTDTHRFESDVRVGVSTILCYDPVQRVVATLHPDHTWEKVVFGPWRQESWATTDTVALADPATDADVGPHFSRRPRTDYLPTWHALRTDPAHSAAFMARYPDMADRVNETQAAERTEVFAATPTVVHADSLGRAVAAVVHNRFKYSMMSSAEPPVEEFERTVTLLDIEGNMRETTDTRGRLVARHDYDMHGTPIHQASMEGGERWSLPDVAGQPWLSWDSRGHRHRVIYDALHRPTDTFLRAGTGPDAIVERCIYGESRPSPHVRNLRGRLVERRDQAGVEASDEYDFKGNLLTGRRTLAQDYKNTLDWSGAPPLQSEIFTSRTTYDALNRPVQLVTPHSDRPESKVNVLQPVYNEANLLDRISTWFELDTEPAGLLDPATASLNAVTNVDYAANGQRTLIRYGNGAETRYTYDPVTYRLTQLVTRREAAASPDVQDLRYTYDAAGNVTHIRDEAQQAIYFRNRRVEPSSSYIYDAAGRLIEATGREHLGQADGTPKPHSYNDMPRIPVLHPGDGLAMGRYVERYFYDTTGNIVSIRHQGSDPANAGWTRTFAYDETSQLNSGHTSNRLTSTTVGGITETFSHGGDGYDQHGNLLRMAQLQAMRWDDQDQLQMTQRQAVNASDSEGVQRHGERTWYVYDSSGQRVRKVTERANGEVKEERIYLETTEIHRTHGANPLTRELLHVHDDQQRIVVVETRVSGQEAGVPRRLIRYQFGNHLQSVVLELGDTGEIISYEELSPYGSTTYLAVRRHTEAPKRYRSSGKERDEESGLYYFGARYYAPWLGRWTACDPAGYADGLNSYAYVRNNPVLFMDPRGENAAAFAAGKAWERQVFDKIDKVIPIVEQVTVRATIDGKTVTSVLDGLGRDANGWVVLESKLNPGNQLSAGQDAIRAHLAAGGEVTIAATDKAKLAELRDKLKTGPKASVSTNRYKIINQGNAANVLADLKAIPAGHGTVLHASGELTVHPPDEMKKISAIRAENPGMDMKKVVAKAKEVSPDSAKVVTKEAKVVKAGTEVLEKGGKTAARKLGTKALKVIPFVGIASGLYSTKAEAAEGNYGTASLEAVGMVPVVGDVVDAARLGVAVGEVGNELMGIDIVAAEHGERFEKAAKWTGLGEDASRIAGATGAALSAITVAPSIAISRKVVGWLK